MTPIVLTPEEQADPYLATSIVDHDRAWEEVLNRQEEAIDKWQRMSKEQVDELLRNQQASLGRYKEARESLQRKRPLARTRRLKAATAAGSGAIGGSSYESDHAAAGSGAPMPPTPGAKSSGGSQWPDAPES